MNRDSLINKALEDAVSNPIWFLFVVCMVAALAALVLIVLIVIAAYRRWKRMKKEEHQTRRAAKYMKRGKRAKAKAAGLGEDGEESFESEEDEGDTEDLPAMGPRGDVVVDFDDIGDASAALDGTLWTSFRREFAGTVDPMGGKKAGKGGKDGGAKLETLNVAQFNRRSSDADPHLMPNKKKNTFVDDVLDTEAKARLKRLQSLSVMFNEATRNDGLAGMAPAAEDNDAADALANSITAMAAASETLKNQLEQDGRRRLAEVGGEDGAIDPTSEEYAELCRRASAQALGRRLSANGAAAANKPINRHRRGSVGAGFTGLHPTAITKTPEEIQAEEERRAAAEEQKRRTAEEDGALAGPTYGGRTGGRTNRPLNDALEDFKAFDFETNTDQSGQDEAQGSEAAPTAAIAATSAAAPINMTRKDGISAIRLGHDVNEFDDFEPDEEYDFSHLAGKAQTAITAEAMLGTQFKPKRPPTGGTNRSSTNRSAVSAGDVNLNFFDAGDDFDVDAIAAELGLNDRWAAPTHSTVPIPPEDDEAGFDFDMDDQGPSAPTMRPFSPQASAPQPRPSVRDDLRVVNDDDELDLDAAELDLGDLGIDRLEIPVARVEAHVHMDDRDIEGLFDDVDIE